MTQEAREYEYVSATNGWSIRLHSQYIPGGSTLAVYNCVGERTHFITIGSDMAAYLEDVFKVAAPVQAPAPAGYAPDERRVPFFESYDVPKMLEEIVTLKARAEKAEGQLSIAQVNLSGHEFMLNNARKVIEKMAEEVKSLKQQRDANGTTMMAHMKRGDEFEKDNELLTERTGKLEATIRALAPYREFFDTLSTVVKLRV